MKEAKILAVGGGWPGIAPAIKKEMKVRVDEFTSAGKFIEGRYRQREAQQAFGCHNNQRLSKTAFHLMSQQMEIL